MPGAQQKDEGRGQRAAREHDRAEHCVEAVEADAQADVVQELGHRPAEVGGRGQGQTDARGGGEEPTRDPAGPKPVISVTRASVRPHRGGLSRADRRLAPGRIGPDPGHGDEGDGDDRGKLDRRGQRADGDSEQRVAFEGQSHTPADHQPGHEQVVVGRSDELEEHERAGHS